MTTDTAHVGQRIDAPADQVYAFVADPANLPRWAAGLGAGVEQVDGQWFVPSDAGPIQVTFAPPNEFGVLDHLVVFPSGEQNLNPLRVVPYGDGCEITFSVRRAPGTTDDDFARDADLVAADLMTIKKIFEAA